MSFAFHRTMAVMNSNENYVRGTRQLTKIKRTKEKEEKRKIPSGIKLIFISLYNFQCMYVSNLCKSFNKHLTFCYHYLKIVAYFIATINIYVSTYINVSLCICVYVYDKITNTNYMLKEWDVSRGKNKYI